MLKFSKKTQYAMVALLHLKHCANEGQETARSISQRYDFPEEYLGKVLQKMAKAGLLESVRGADGGYRLAVPYHELSVGSVVDAIGERPTTAIGGDEKSPCSAAERHAQCADECTCYVQGALEDVQTKVMEFLETLPLSEVLAESPVTA